MVSSSIKGDSETYALGNASANISFDVAGKLLGLNLDPVWIPQRLASSGVQETEGIDRIEVSKSSASMEVTSGRPLHALLTVHFSCLIRKKAWTVT